MATDKKLKATLIIGGTMSGSLKTALGSTKISLDRLGKSIRLLNGEQRQLGKSIQVFGRMGKNVDGMRFRYLALSRQLDRTQAMQNRLNKAQEHYNKLTAAADRMKSAGIKSSIGGAAIGIPMLGVTNAAKEYQQQRAKLSVLGIGNSAIADAARFANKANVYGVSKAEKLGLMTDAISIFGNVADAKMALPLIARAYFANRAIYGKDVGDENTSSLMNAMKVAELRGGTKSPAEFARQVNMIQQVINATQGKVGADQWKDLIATGGIAAKGLSDRAFYYELEPAVQEMGGHRVGTALQTAYQELYQGHTTKRAAKNLEKYGLIGDPSKVTYDKTGQVAFLNPGALKGSALFQKDQFQWMKQVLLPMLKEHGVTSQKGIMDAIGSIMGRTAANLYSTWYTQQHQVERRAKQNAEAENIDQMNATAKNSPTGKELQVKARFADLQKRLGNDVLPLYTKALTLAAGALERLNKFTARHPRLARDMMVGLAGVGASLTVLGPLLMTVGGGLALVAGGSMALTRFGFIGSAAFRMVGTAAIWARRALFSLVIDNPIGAAVTAVAVGGFLIWKYWKPLGAFFSTLWKGIVADFRLAVHWIGSQIDALEKRLHGFINTIEHPGRVVGEVGHWANGKLHDLEHLVTGAPPRGGNVAVTNHNTVTINAAPGQDGAEIWKQVQRQMGQKKQAAAAMYDPVLGF